MFEDNLFCRSLKLLSLSLSLFLPPPPFLSSDCITTGPGLNPSPGRTVFRYQAFHMTLLTLSLYALLHPDSLKNGLPACGTSLEAILWLSSLVSNVTNGKPWRRFRGITQKQSLKRQGCAYRCTLAVNVLKCLFPMQMTQSGLCVKLLGF